MVLEQGGKGKHRTSSGPSGPSGGVSGIGGKMDWIVIMEFEKPVEQGSERGFTKVPINTSSYSGRGRKVSTVKEVKLIHR